MAKKDARKQFVQARLKATGKEATPEQRAKFRQRFNTLSQTKEGRTRIAQVLLPEGSAAERLALKQSIRPPKTGTKTTPATTTAITPATTKPVDLTGVRDATPYTARRLSGVISGSDFPKTNAETSAVVGAAKKTNAVYGDQPEEKIALKLEQLGVPVFRRVAGIGRAIDERKWSDVAQKGIAAFLDAAATGLTLGAAPAIARAAKNKFPTVGPTNQTSLRIENRVLQKDITKLQNQKWNAQQGLLGHTTPGGIRAESSVQALQGRLGGPANYPVYSPPRTGSRGGPPGTSGKEGPAFPDNRPFYGPELPPTPVTVPKAPTPVTVPKAPTPVTVPKAPKSTKPTATTVPKTTTATTVPKTTTATTVPSDLVKKNQKTLADIKASVSSPPTTVVAGSKGSNFDILGSRVKGSYKDPVLGDPMPTPPRMPRNLNAQEKKDWKMSDAMLEYEDAIYAWKKLHGK